MSGDALPSLPPRKPESHKGDYGRALLIGGSQGMAGAIALSGMAALRSGAGLVKLATANSCQATVASFEPSAMTIGLAADEQGRISEAALPTIIEAAKEATVVACGPGLGRSDGLTQVVAWLYQNISQPLVLDADALTLVAGDESILAKAAGPRILTPHPGEFARLLGRQSFPPSEREKLAREFARQKKLVLVLKGHHTVISDGTRTAINHTGNPGMATGGTGDVLTGVITAIVGQGLPPYDAARLGVHVHGLAGDLAAAELGQVSLIASDLVTHLPRAWKSLAGGQ
ncbi:MAG TPA: NAD(P)H-hydrate dehydratase [Pirellulales bacterium]|jgi:ADP-dependent NAD(P)H-hydrate dehydratase|nr:NAD(P)H-hydrate dehydratase [Pirellulales bacterium]